MNRAAPKSSVTHEECVRWYNTFIQEKEAQNARARRDRNYYDGIQWDKDDVKKLKARGQPVLTFNRIHPKINSILGQEIRTRVDPEALPRTPFHEESRYAITDALRYLDDHVGFDRIRSFGTEDCLIQGLTACVVGWDGKEIFTKRVPWRQFFYDVRSIEPDFSDAYYKGIANWWSLRDALADPDYAATKEQREILESSVSRQAGTWSEGGTGHDVPDVWSDDKERRVKICEVYWKEGKIWWTATYTIDDFLIPPKPVPYMDDTGEANFCPLMATSCYVVQEAVDEENDNLTMVGERYGIVRNMICAQDEINQRRSKFMYAENVYGAIAEDGAIPNKSEFLHQMARPDGIAEVRRGALTDGSVQIRDNRDIAQGNLQLLQDARMEIDATGPSLPVTAGDDSVLSGRAILAKQSIGSMEIQRAFDNIREWQLSVYKSWWFLVRQNWTEERHLRVTDSARKEGYRFVALNKPMTRAQRVRDLLQKDVPFDSAIKQVGLQAGQAEAIFARAQQQAQQRLQMQMQQSGINPQQIPPEVQQQIQQAQQQMVMEFVMGAPAMLEVIRDNAVEQLDMDIIIDTAPDTSIAAQEEFAELIDLFAAKQAHMLPKPILTALVESSQLRNKPKLIEALNQPPDPQQVQLQQAQIQAQLQMMQAQIQELTARAQHTVAKVATEQASAAEKVAKAQIGIPAEAEKDRAVGMSAAAEAGTKTVPLGPAKGAF